MNKTAGQEQAFERLRAGSLISEREPDESWVAAASRDFLLDAFGILAVSRRTAGDGTVTDVIIDGRNRLALAIRVLGPDVRVPCRVCLGLTPQDEARRFYALNEIGRLKAPGRKTRPAGNQLHSAGEQPTVPGPPVPAAGRLLAHQQPEGRDTSRLRQDTEDDLRHCAVPFPLDPPEGRPPENGGAPVAARAGRP